MINTNIISTLYQTILIDYVEHIKGGLILEFLQENSLLPFIFCYKVFSFILGIINLRVVK